MAERPINPVTKEPHDICRADTTALRPRDIRGEGGATMALIFGECPVRTEKGISSPLRFPALIATGLAEDEAAFLKRLEQIINAGWYEPPGPIKGLPPLPEGVSGQIEYRQPTKGDYYFFWPTSVWIPSPPSVGSILAKTLCVRPIEERQPQ
jgi:hypothetical protein